MKPRHASLAIAAACAAVLACGGSSGTSNTFVAQLNGANETPANSETGTGTATITRNGATVNYSVSATGLTGNATGAHIHIGPAGQAGPIIVDTFALTPPPPGTSTSFSGSFTEANIKNPTTPPLSPPIATLDQLFDAIRAGNAYYNIHTAKHSGGEIRGQLVAQ
jgi:CHRD domain